MRGGVSLGEGTLTYYLFSSFSEEIGACAVLGLWYKWHVSFATAFICIKFK